MDCSETQLVKAVLLLLTWLLNDADHSECILCHGYKRRGFSFIQVNAFPFLPGDPRGELALMKERLCPGPVKLTREQVHRLKQLGTTLYVVVETPRRRA